ncbi:MAG: hypothetical protein SNJ63_09990, partial [Sphingomonadaceae bacterium]
MSFDAEPPRELSRAASDSRGPPPALDREPGAAELEAQDLADMRKTAPGEPAGPDRETIGVAPPFPAASPAGGGPDWLWLAIGLLAGALVGFLVARLLGTRQASPGPSA